MLDLFNVLDNVCVGVIGANGVPGTLAKIVHYIYLAIQVAVPIMLIIFGMIDLAKAITASKEDEIKKAQSEFLRKLVLAIIIFLVFTIVQFVFQFAAGDTGTDQKTAWDCVCELMKGKEC